MNVIPFTKSYRNRVEVIVGRDRDTGRRVWLFDLIEPEGRCIIADCYTLEDVMRTTAELRSYGYSVIVECTA